jgi:Uncharacterised protein family (UPF0175)
MHISLEIPDSIPNVVAPDQDPARAALEAMALEAYRSKRLGESAVRRLLGFGTRMEVHAFLKDHGVYLNYSMEDLERDIREADRIVAILNARDATGEQHP